MASETTFRMKFSGESSSVASHRLSIGDFFESFQALLLAFRHKAEEIEGGKSNVARVGKLGKHFDLQLIQMEPGSIDLTFACVYDGETNVDDLVPRVTKSILEDIEHESLGTRHNERVRLFLSKLPRYIVFQEYEGRWNNESCRVRLGDVASMNLMVRQRSSYRVFRGRPWGVTFRQSVKLKTLDGRVIPCVANEDIVNAVIRCRDEVIDLRVVCHHDEGRFVAIGVDAVEQPSTELTHEEVSRKIDVEWAEVFRRLAQ